MSEEQIIRISDVGEFVNWVEGLQLGGDALYRGMSSEGYKASASLSRRMTDPEEQIKPTEWEMWEETFRLIEGAKSEGHDREPTQRGETPGKDFELLARLQHHGAATLLIDFSYSPLVALWFACRDGHDGRVIVVDSNDSRKFGKIDVEKQTITQQGIIDRKDEKQQASHSPSSSQDTTPIKSKPVRVKLTDFTIEIAPITTPTESKLNLWRFRPPGFDARVVAQRSEFILGKTELEKNDIYAECIIAQDAKVEIRRQLSRRYGISDEQLFRDFQGYASINAQDRPIKKTIEQYNRSVMNYLQMRKYDQAIAELGKIIHPDLKLTEPYITRATVYMFRNSVGDDDLAIKDMTKAIGMLKNSASDDDRVLRSVAEALNNRGFAYSKRGDAGDCDLSIRDLKEALHIDPNMAGVHNNLGNVYNLKGKYDLAITHFQKAVDISPDYAQAYNNLGIAYGLKDNYDEAIACYKKTLLHDPYYIEAYRNRGKIYSTRGVAYHKKGDHNHSKEDFDCAIADFKKVIDSNPNDAKAYFFRSLVAGLLNNIKGATADAHQALTLATQQKNTILIKKTQQLLDDLSQDNPTD